MASETSKKNNEVKSNPKTQVQTARGTLRVALICE